MTKIIQISAVRVSDKESDLEPMVLGLGEDGGVYEWNIKTGTWTLWGVNNSARTDFQPHFD